MKYNVIWTAFAQNELAKIHFYYRTRVGSVLANKLKRKLIVDSLRLESFPNARQSEQSILIKGVDYRYLISTHYKIIFWVNEVKSEIVIVHVFDTRRNPDLISSFI